MGAIESRNQYRKVLPEEEQPIPAGKSSPPPSFLDARLRSCVVAILPLIGVGVGIGIGIVRYVLVFLWKGQRLRRHTRA